MKPKDKYIYGYATNEGQHQQIIVKVEAMTKASLEPTLTLAWVRDRSFSSQLFSAEARASMAFQFFSRRSWEERGMVNSQAGLCRAGKPP